MHMEEDAPNSEFLNFQFLLKACEDIAAGNSKGRDDLKNWKSSHAFHHVRNMHACCSRCTIVFLLVFLLVFETVASWDLLLLFSSQVAVCGNNRTSF